MMKNTGMVRPVDVLGRIVIPKEIRKTMQIGEKDFLEIYIEGKDKIVLRPCKLQCVCCGDRNEKKLSQVDGVHLCERCVEKFGGLVK